MNTGQQMADQPVLRDLQREVSTFYYSIAQDQARARQAGEGTRFPRL